MGEPSPDARYLVRIDPAKPYEPGNCVWSAGRTRRFLTHGGRTLSISEWARELGMPTCTLHYRLKSMPVHEALTPRSETPTRIIDLTGKTFGQLLVLAYAGSLKNNTYWTCECLGCGSIRDYRGGNLRSGLSTACHHCPAKSRKRGGSKVEQPGYRSWRRISTSGEVCKRWLSYERFIEDMGEPPEGKLVLARLDSTKPYRPGNCTWSAGFNEKVLTHNGETLSVSAWARNLGLSHQTLSARLKKMSVHEALTKPVRTCSSRRTG